LPIYAEKTTVSVESSRMEIERTLQRYGADQFMYGWDGNQAIIQFTAHNRRVKFMLTLPEKTDRRFTHSARGIRTTEVALREWEQGCRQRWRALNLVIKAKLEAVAAGISEFEEEFLAHIIMPNGETVGEWMKPQVNKAYTTGKMPDMFPQLGSGE
jgi:hypothetical protein